MAYGLKASSCDPLIQVLRVYEIWKNVQAKLYPWNLAPIIFKPKAIQWGNTYLRDRCIQRTIIHKQNSFWITSRGVQRWTSTDFRLNIFYIRY